MKLRQPLSVDDLLDLCFPVGVFVLGPVLGATCFIVYTIWGHCS